MTIPTINESILPIYSPPVGEDYISEKLGRQLECDNTFLIFHDLKPPIRQYVAECYYLELLKVNNRGTL